MRYLIDGYNFLFISSLSKESFQKKRELVLRFLKNSTSALKFKIVVIFDGQSNSPEIVRTHMGDLEVIYTSENQTADAFILEELLALKPKQSIVVTSDNGLSRRARGIGAQTMTIEEFLSLLEKKKEDKKTFKNEKPSCDSEKDKKRLEDVFQKRIKDP